LGKNWILLIIPIYSAFFILVSACSNKSNNIWSSPASLAGIFFAKIILLQAFAFFVNVLTGLIATALQVYATSPT
jgi:hypothetical protein